MSKLINIQSRVVIYKILLEFLNTKKQFKLILNKHLSQKSCKDKNFITALSYGTIEKFYLLNYKIEQFSKFKNNNKTTSILLLSTYQIMFMKSIPEYAIVHSAVEISKLYTPTKSAFINAILRKILSNKEFSDIDFCIRYSYPKWLYNKFLIQHGKINSHNIIKWFDINRTLWIRCINTRTKNNIIKLLDKENINHCTHIDLSNYISIAKSNNKLIKKIISNRLGYVQSPSSGYVVKLLNPSNKDRIIDACASPGGKTLYISSLVNNKNKVVAYEIDTTRFNQLNDNISNYKVKNIQSLNDNFFNCKLVNINKILLDVPCSGTGVINRKPDIKLRRKRNDISKFSSYQLKLLNYAAKLLKKDGTIVYSTCSILNEENWDVINAFLINNNFNIVHANNYILNKFTDKYGAMRILPNKHKLDGMFAVRLEKN